MKTVGKILIGGKYEQVKAEKLNKTDTRYSCMGYVDESIEKLETLLNRYLIPLRSYHLIRSI